MDCILDDVILNIGFKFHRQAKIGASIIPIEIYESHEVMKSETYDRVDIFGNEATSLKNHRAPDCVKCICLECQQPIAAARFAPHLEKCIGMGRNSSRVAKKRLAASYAKRVNEFDELDIGDEATSEDGASYGLPEDDEWSRKRKSKSRTKRKKANMESKKANS